MSKQRIATVKATGDRYIVQRMSIGSDESSTRVFVWGEVTSYKTGRGYSDEERLATGASTKHADSKVFVRSAVDIEEVEVTGHFAQKLMAQAMRNLKNVRGVSSSRRVK
jgi:hypothetical protein